MLRNLSAGSISTDRSWIALYAYLRSLKEKPARMAAAIAALIIPGAALGWWYYSFAMSLGAVTPLRPAVDSSDLQVPDPQSSPEAVSDSSTTTTPTSSPDQADVNINSSSNTNSSQTNVEVNGQQVVVPENGSTHQVIESENGKTTVDINVNSNTSGSSESRSSTNVKMRSSSNSDLNIKTKEVQ
jgi:cytoskeletal protein RodZ